jgi:3-dehydrosphinganine reductase
MTKLAGSRVLIAGGSQGIGAAFAAEAVASGARVALLARREPELRATAERLGADWRAVDVTDAAATAAAIADLERDGGFDIVLTTAGGALPGRFLEVPIEEFRAQMETNYLGAVHVARAALPGMVARGQGHLVFTSSTAGLIGVVGYTGYAPTKFAIRGLADSLRYEVEPSGVRVSVLFPPDTETPGLDRENLRKPVETAAVSGAITPVAAKKVADALVRGLERNRDAIAIDPLTRALIPLGGVLEPLARGSVKRTIAKALARG